MFLEFCVYATSDVLQQCSKAPSYKGYSIHVSNPVCNLF